MRSIFTIFFFFKISSDGQVLDTTESFELNKFRERFHIHDSDEKEE